MFDGIDPADLTSREAGDLERAIGGFLQDDFDANEPGTVVLEVAITNLASRRNLANIDDNRYRYLLPQQDEPLVIEVLCEVSQVDPDRLRQLRRAGLNFLYGAITSAVASGDQALVEEVKQSNPRAFGNVLGVLQIEPPSMAPSAAPSRLPSYKPSDVPSYVPSDVPSKEPSKAPSDVPSLVPSISNKPSNTVSLVPSSEPTISNPPTISRLPSDAPSWMPSGSPSDVPSIAPSSMPSSVPSGGPTADVQQWMVEMLSIVNEERAKGMWLIDLFDCAFFGFYISLRVF